MNVLINAINEKTKIILENDGRLLKKSFFGLLLLSLVFKEESLEKLYDHQ